jgi:hypothetical protein
MQLGPCITIRDDLYGNACANRPPEPLAPLGINIGTSGEPSEPFHLLGSLTSERDFPRSRDHVTCRV